MNGTVKDCHRLSLKTGSTTKYQRSPTSSPSTKLPPEASSMSANTPSPRGSVQCQNKSNLTLEIYQKQWALLATKKGKK